MIREYTHPLLIGKKCLIHDDFVPGMDMLCQYLKIAECSLSVNSSFRLNSDHLQGAIVKPATHSDHFIGCAVDANIIDSKGKMWTSEEMLQPTAEVLMFINLVRRSPLLRWGGDFHSAPDSIHFDNGLNIKNPVRWQEIYDELHNPTPNA